MKKRQIYYCSVALCAISGISHTSAQEQKYNILFIAIDDLKPELGCYGNKLIKTPNIDKLADRGTVFASNHCQQAVSGPTRASIMTGKRPDYTQVWDLKTRMRDINPDIVTLPQYLASQGYETTSIGKIYDPRCVDSFADKPSWTIPAHEITRYPEGFTPPALDYFQDPETKRLVEKYEAEAAKLKLDSVEARKYVVRRIKPSTENIDVPDAAYKDGAMVVQAKDIMSDLAKGNKPFFLGVGFARPHLPFVAPTKYWDMYDREDMSIEPFQLHAKNTYEFAYHNSWELRSYTDIPLWTSFTDKREAKIPLHKQKELIHGYYAAISFVDAQIGILLEQLDSLGLTDNTIIILWGDHGWHFGDHDLWCKQTNFEQATRSPLIISAPELKKGYTTSLTEFVDVFPTLVDLTSLPIPDYLDGKSLVPLMKQPEKEFKGFAVSQYPRDDGVMGYTIRTKRYRYTCWMKDNYTSAQPLKNDHIFARELYDYDVDPLETTNVVNETDYLAVAKELDKTMKDFLKSQIRK
ncbi:sulfatase [Dysgonomonas sp. 520]|uniref:sulfatase n=1 Tax=Dysgonomonas sp. 520 TaxID=2302931 RepID=UPI0013D1C4E7|nr:sulfatase [Dysgonomonas sp. 520]NDW09637.1 DUF229 domain-containing protein [Dysgonomonas sp. 520]